MAQKFTQDQKGFSQGQVSKAQFAQMGDGYLQSCLKLKNFMVKRDGSLEIRHGFTDQGTIPGNNFTRMIVFQGVYFFVAGGSELSYLLPNNTRKVISYTNFVSMTSYDITTGSEASHYLDTADLGMQNFMFQGETQITDLKVISGDLWVFFNNSVPFKISKKDNTFLVRPFFGGRLYNGFRKDLLPYMYPIHDVQTRMQYDDFVYKKQDSGSFVPFTLVTRPEIKFVKNPSTGKYKAFMFFDYANFSVPGSYYVKRNVANLSHLLGKPILAQVSNPRVNTTTGALGALINALTATTREAVRQATAFVLREMNIIWGFPVKQVDINNSWAVEGSDADKAAFGGYVRASEFYANPEGIELSVQMLGVDMEKALLNLGTDFTSKKFSVYDWADAFPKSGGAASGKTFFITPKAKISFSGNLPIRQDVLEPAFCDPLKSISNFARIRTGIDSGLLTLNSAWVRIKSQTPVYEYVFNNLMSSFFRTYMDSQDYTLNLQYNIGDPATYRIQDEAGDDPEVFNFEVMLINTQKGNSQAIMSTSSGIYYWGLDAFNPQSGVSGLVARKTTDFFAKPEVNILETHNKLYVVGEGEEGVYLNRFSERASAFITEIVNPKFPLENTKKLLAWFDDKILVLQDDGRLLFGNVMNNGMLMGFTEMELANYLFVDMVEYNREYLFLVQNAGVFKVVKFDKDKSKEGIKMDLGSHFKATFTSMPITVGRHFPQHGIQFSRKITNIVSIGDRLKSLKLGVEKADGTLVPNTLREMVSVKSSDGLVYMDQLQKFTFQLPFGYRIYGEMSSVDADANFCGFSVQGSESEL